jgi:RNA polymerase sigma-70 factor (ECF subfamily)
MAEPERGQILKLVGSPRASQPDALAQLAEAAAGGDRRAIRTLLSTVAPQLLQVTRRVLGAAHPDIEDTAQESAFALIESLPSHRGECSVLHFACRIAVLTAMNVRRREAAKKRASIREHAVEIELFPSAGLSPDAEMTSRARTQAVRELLDTLPPEQAEVLAMHCVLGYTVREIAEASRAPVETVRSRLRLAKQALRTRIAKDPELGKIVEER